MNLKEPSKKSQEPSYYYSLLITYCSYFSCSETSLSAYKTPKIPRQKSKFATANLPLLNRKSFCRTISLPRKVLFYLHKECRLKHHLLHQYGRKFRCLQIRRFLGVFQSREVLRKTSIVGDLV